MGETEGAELELPIEWTAIATRPRDPEHSSLLTWSRSPGAPFGLQEARDLVERHVLVMASRHMPDRIELVVRARREGPSPGG